MKFVIEKNQIPHEYLDAMAKTYSHLEYIKNSGIIMDKTFDGKQIPILSGGGSGHEPAHMGYVGKGMLTASVSGSLFVPPEPKYILEAIERLDNGKGVFCIIKNFDADIENFQKAIYQARKKGIDVRYIITHDDVSVEVFDFKQRHRGVCGTILVHKILGAAARHGASLEELEHLGQSLTPNINTLGVALDGIRYLYGDNSFDLATDEICFGIGIHGEPGYRIEKFESYERIAIELVNKLKHIMAWQEGEQYIAVVNGMGSTTMMELFTFHHNFLRLVELEGLKLSFCKVGNFMTSCDMSGISLTLCPVKDPKWLDYLNESTNAFAW